ncbi:MAG: protein kinase [Gemmataceae bacterium]
MDRTEHVSVGIATPAPVRATPPHLRPLADVVQGDLARQLAAGLPTRLDDYATDLPELFADPAAARSLARFEARLHAGAGDPAGNLAVAAPVPAGRVARTWVDSVGRTRGTEIGSEPTPLSVPTAPGATRPSADRPARTSFPKVGDRFLGFALKEELGRGAFARVFLAEQLDLADRLVALKVTVRPTREPQRLARLRHTNIVPIYSVHDRAPLQAVCMPFLGRRTLADLIKSYRATGSLPFESHHSTVAEAHRSTLRSLPSGPAPADAPPIPDPAHMTAAWEALAKLSHPDRVLWIVTRLADGLAHAHEAGILHLDLKPANVLFGDDGQPLLLDFNLSYDVAAGDRERAGGTLPYMAPEQLEEYRDGGPTRVDTRTDLYGLGVIFFELLTGKHPFPLPKGRTDLTRLAADRRAGAPGPRAVARTVSPAVDAIVRKLLAPEPADRYQSARDLLCDLERQRDHRPLRFAADRSVVERAGKWRRRHPRAALHLALAGLVLATGGAGVTAVRASAARAHAAAVTQADRTRNELTRLRADLVSRDDAVRQAAQARGAGLLAAYGLPADPDWAAAPAARPLSDADRAALGDRLGELALLLAHSERLDDWGRTTAGRADRALAWNRVAEACFAGRPVPAVVAEQRKAIDPAALPPAVVDDTPTPLALYFRGLVAAAAGRFRDASNLLDELADRDPGHFAGQLALGTCLMELRDFPRAAERFRMANAIVPADHRPTYHRGQVLLMQGKYREAEKAFADAIGKDETFADGYRHRGIARLKQADHRGAVADFTKALDLGASEIEIRLLRAEAHRGLKDAAAEAADLAAADTLTPAQPSEYHARALHRRTADPKAALADVEKAVEAHPGFTQALQTQAHLLSERLGRPAEALAALDRAIESSPEYALAWAGRAVVHARLGRRAEAHRDAEKAMLLSGGALITYQAGCAYALTAKDHPADQDRAVDLIRKALRDGFRRFDEMKADADIEAVRDLPAVRDAIAAAETLVK